MNNGTVLENLSDLSNVILSGALYTTGGVERDPNRTNYYCFDLSFAMLAAVLTKDTVATAH